MPLKVRVLQEGFLPDDREAVIEFQVSNAALLRFLQPFEVDGELIEYAVARCRHEGVSIDDLNRKGSILCNLTAQPRERAVSNDPLDLSWWRGGKAAITTLVRL